MNHFAAILLQVSLITGQPAAPATNAPPPTERGTFTSGPSTQLVQGDPTLATSARLKKSGAADDIVNGLVEGLVFDTASGLWTTVNGGAWLVTHPVTAVKAVGSAAVTAGSAVGSAATALYEHPVDTLTSGTNSTLSATEGALTNAKDAWDNSTTEQRARLVGNGLSLLIPVGGEASALAKAGKVGELVNDTRIAAETAEKAATLAAETGTKLEKGTEQALANAAKEPTGCVGGQCGLEGSCFVAGTAVELDTGQVAIEQVPVGARVRTLGDEACAAIPHEGAFARVGLRVPSHDGSGEIVDVELLRSAAWVAEHDVVAGERLAIEIRELGLAGFADVVSLEGAGALTDGPGCLVTGRLHHYNAHVLSTGLDGVDDALRVTTLHPLFSATRGGWVRAGDLVPGETLVARDGYAVVSSVEPLDATLLVYNLEVEGLHTYRVAKARVLVHNACADAIYKTNAEALAAATKLGFTQVKGATSHGNAVFTNGKVFISADADGHSGGAWKLAKSVEKLATKETRLGTYDVKLTWIGP